MITVTDTHTGKERAAFLFLFITIILFFVLIKGLKSNMLSYEVDKQASEAMIKDDDISYAPRPKVLSEESSRLILRVPGQVLKRDAVTG